MDFSIDPSGPPLDSSKEVDTSNTKLSLDFKKIVHWHKCLVSHLTFSDKSDILHSDFLSGDARSGSNRSYILELGLRSAAWRIESNCGTQYIQRGGMVPDKPKHHNYYQGELGVPFRVMCAIKIMEFILGITTLLLNSCDNIITLRQVTIRWEAVKLRWKQVDLLSRLSGIYQ